MVQHKKIIFRHTLLEFPILIFILSQVLATIFSIDQRTSVLGYYGRFHGGLLSYICYAILYFAFVTFMNKKRVSKFLTTLLISTALAALYASFEHFGYSPSCLIITGNFDVACWVQKVNERVFGTFGQPNWLAAYLTSLVPLTWYYAAKQKAPLNKKSFIYLTLFLLMFTTLLFTKSRSGFLGFGVSFIIFWALAFYFSKNTKKLLKIFSLITISILIIGALIWSPFTKSTEPPLEGVTESGEIRRIVWNGAIELWKKYPLLGTGVETFAYSYYETRPMEHNLTSEWNYLYNKAHNEYLNFAATTGTLGFASYIFLIFSILVVFCKSEKNLLNFAFLSGFISILVTNFFGFSTTTTGLLFFLFPAFTIGLNAKAVKLPKIKYKNNILLVPVLLAALYLLFNTTKYWFSDYFYAQKDMVKAVALSPNEPLFRLEPAKNSPSELKAVEKMAPRNVKLMKSIASSYSDLEEYEEENRILTNLTKLAPTDASLFYSLALSYGRLGNLPQAKKSLEKALVLKPDYELARNLLDRLP